MRIFFLNILFIVSLYLLSDCRQNSIDETAGIAVIDVINNIGSYQKIYVSELVSDLEYIPLETNDNCLIAAVRNMVVTPSHIFVQAYRSFGSPDLIMPGATRCYAFSRDGRFLCEIGRVGQGPGEYQSIMGLSIDEKNQLLYIETPRTILEYSYDGIFHRSIHKPQNLNELPIREVIFVHDNLFIGHSPNHRGNEMYTFVLFNDSGRVIKTFDNHVKFNRTGDGVSIESDAMFPFSVSDYIFVKEVANDTLFRLNEQNDLIPQFVFNVGKYTFQDKRGKEIRAQDYMSDVLMIPHGLYPMIGTPDYIFFSIGDRHVNIPKPKARTEGRYHPPRGIYDIANKTTRLLDSDSVSRQMGLINDIDGGFAFWPKYYSSDNVLVDVQQAYEMIEKLTNSYFTGRTIKNPQAHQKLKELLKKLDEEDNPVIVIAKLKK